MTQPTRISLSLAQSKELLAGWLGSGVVCSAVGPLTGGMCHSVFHLRFDRPPHDAVVKLSPEPDAQSAFEVEKSHLEYLHRETDLRCPKAYRVGAPSESVPYASLLVERLPGVNLICASLQPEERVQVDQEIADALLALHAHTRDTFGAIDQKPGVTTWADIVVGRLSEMRDAMSSRLPSEVLADIDHALLVVPEVMRPQGTPSLVHGDVWAGNVMVERRHDGWHLSGFLDPGLQYADVEQELAYLQVFKTVGPTFFEVYTARTPFRPGYEVRRLFYWLNTMMLHVWLFGDGKYRDSTASLAAEIRCRV